MKHEKSSEELEGHLLHGVVVLCHIEENEQLLFNANRVTFLEKVIFANFRDEGVEICALHGTVHHVHHAAEIAHRLPFHRCCSRGLLHSTGG